MSFTQVFIILCNLELNTSNFKLNLVTGENVNTIGQVIDSVLYNNQIFQLPLVF